MTVKQNLEIKSQSTYSKSDTVSFASSQQVSTSVDSAQVSEDQEISLQTTESVDIEDVEESLAADDDQEEEQQYEDCEKQHQEQSDTNSSLSPATKAQIKKFVSSIYYSERYRDSEFEYRHVILPKEYYNHYIDDHFKDRLLSEEEWRSLGIQQSLGWIHYELHKPEPHILLFKRDI
ncbi:hypothetical protein MP228_008370 [Amoeboaphelidium protococcarum]|nr:hypothetical protein MP228_008370 [Amoeboaphelidium protococcarum]